MKYYAVRQGRQVGIFTDWNECKRLVTGYKGAEFKGFTSRDDALAYLEAGGKTELPADNSPDTAVAYVDGSYNIRTKRFGCGAVILHNGSEEHISKGFEDEELASMRNVAGEIKGSLAAMNYCLENDIKNLYICYDYSGIEKWCTGEWKTNKTATAAYKAFYDEVKERINITFYKVKGHSGDKYNDLADSLAKAAAGVTQ